MIAKILEATARFVKRPAVRVAVLVAVPTVLIVAVFVHYCQLAEPRHSWTQIASDWAAWGTWIGAAFTGGALIFAGFQFRLQSQALGAELANSVQERQDRQRARFAMARQVELTVIRRATLLWRAKSSSEMSEGRGYVDTEGQFTVIRLCVPAQIAISKVVLHFATAFLVAPSSTVRGSTYEGEPKPRDIKLPLMALHR